MFGSDYYGCLGCDQKFGEEVCQPTIVEYFMTDSIRQVSCGDCHVVALAGNAYIFSFENSFNKHLSGTTYPEIS